MTNKKRLNILYTNIGRGHPFYLDGICEEIRNNRSETIEIFVNNVFDLSNRLSLRLWKLIRFMYLKGSQGGLAGKIYSTIRKNRKTDSYGFVEKILARGIRNYLKKNNRPTLIAHPILIPMISDLVDVYYQHGELAVPDLVLAGETCKIFVPTSEAGDRFVQNGVNKNNIFVTGLNIEAKLKESAKEMFDKRLTRLKDKYNPVGAFFSSGAEPIEHINKIIRMLKSLEKDGLKAIVFCKAGGELEKIISSQIGAVHIDPISAMDDMQTYFGVNNILMVSYCDRDDESKYTGALFRYFDYFVSPSHERTNWALGLGIPMFILCPLIGPFSPLNRDILIKNGVAEEIIDNGAANNFAERLRRLTERDELVRMANNGFGKFSLDGFKQICNTLEGSLLKDL